jgi:hypothetical protein
MLGPQNYSFNEAIVLLRPLRALLELEFYPGSHHMTKSQFDQELSNGHLTPQLIRLGQDQVLIARSTLWGKFPESYTEGGVLSACKVYTTGPAPYRDGCQGLYPQKILFHLCGIKCVKR